MGRLIRDECSDFRLEVFGERRLFVRDRPVFDDRLEFGHSYCRLFCVQRLVEDRSGKLLGTVLGDGCYGLFDGASSRADSSPADTSSTSCRFSSISLRAACACQRDST